MNGRIGSNFCAGCHRGGRILILPPERRIHPAGPVPLARLPDESGVPVGSAIRLGGGAEMRPAPIVGRLRV